MEALQLLALLIAPLKGLQVFGTWMAGSAAENCNFFLLNDFRVHREKALKNREKMLDRFAKYT